MQIAANEFVGMTGKGFSPCIHRAGTETFQAVEQLQCKQALYQGATLGVPETPLKNFWALAPEGSFYRVFSTDSVQLLLLFLVSLLIVPALQSQTIHGQTSGPIAIVPLNSKNPDAAAKVTGALEVTAGKAIIAASGEVTAGTETTEVQLPHRGVLRVCASTTVKIAADTSVPAGETPGLVMAMDHGALEMSFATSHNADTLLTPDFRILIGAPGAADLKVRLGQKGDTCVDNAGVSAPYVLVTSIFDGGDYRVQPGQHVMFQHGSLTEVVDSEKEPCGCPPALHPGTNEFPLAQSAGLAPLPKPEPGLAPPNSAPSPIAPLVYNAPKPPAPEPTPAATPSAPKKKTGFFAKVGSFFRRVFGAE